MNSVVVTGNLTRDLKLEHTDGGTAYTNMRVAVNGRRKVGEEWVDDPNFFDVTVWGNRAVVCAEHLAKGSKVGVQGRLDWREWEASDGSGKRQAVQIVAENVEFLGRPPSAAASDAEQEPVPQGFDDTAPEGVPDVAAGVWADIPF